jgi:teichuronic acid biosynthesis glycosyltransferase TuaC
MLDIVTATTLYPNALQPRHGIFVERRLLELSRTGAIDARVVAPVPWFPWRSKRFGRYGVYAEIPPSEVRHGIPVAHPRYPVLPKIGMHVAPALMAAALLPYFRRLQASAARPFLLDGHFLYPDGVALALIARLLKIPIILTARGSDVNLFCRYPGPRAMVRWAGQQCAKVITVSDALRQKLAAIGVPDDAIAVMPNGVDEQLFAPVDRLAARVTMGYDTFTILSVGNLVPLKGHDFVIEAVARIPDARLVIIGEGPCATPLRRLITERGLEQRVSMIGNVSQAELVQHYNAADALVLASSDEGMPNVVLESLACGAPVIGTAVGGIPELITSPDAGLIVPDRNAAAIARAIEALRSAYPDRSRTRRHALKFSWKATVDGLLDIFDDALSRYEQPVSA